VASGSALDINALLITPVQRVLRYPLLLKALVEVTDPSHPDYSHLQTAVEGAPLLSPPLRTMADRAPYPFPPCRVSLSLPGIQKIADEINQSVEVSESTKAVHELAKQIPNIHVPAPFSPSFCSNYTKPVGETLLLCRVCRVCVSCRK
jgi:hypothetical protein